jgi:hypothetical protein
MTNAMKTRTRPHMLPVLMEWPKLRTESMIEKNCRAVIIEAKATAPEDHRCE